MSQPTVSIIISSYNCALYIAETIGSVLAQSLKNIEIIVVDDGSTDDTQKIVSAFGAPVRLITQPNSGVCVARNRGIHEAVGQYICLMDHDDYWFPEKLAQQVRMLQDHPEVGVVYSAFTLWCRHEESNRFPDPSTLNLATDPDDIDEDYSGWIYHQFLLDCWMLTSTAMFRPEVFAECGLFDETLPYSEDWDLWLRISQKYPFIKLRRSTTLYRQHPHQGNRLARDIDYRTRLLKNAVKKWGLCSRDGRCVTRRAFNKQLASYHSAFALGHLRAGNKKLAVTAFLKSWVTSPRNIKTLAYIPAAFMGWKPRW